MTTFNFQNAPNNEFFDTFAKDVFSYGVGLFQEVGNQLHSGALSDLNAAA